MAVVVMLKHVDELSGGRKRFRRRYRKAVAKVLGEPDTEELPVTMLDAKEMYRTERMAGARPVNIAEMNGESYRLGQSKARQDKA